MPCFFGDTKKNIPSISKYIGLFTTKNLDVNPEHDLRPTWIIPGKFCRHEIPLPLVYTETVQKLISEWTENTMMVNLKYIFETGQSSSPNEDGSHRFSIAMWHMWVANYHGRASFTSAGDDIFCRFCLSIYSKTKKPSVYRNIHSILVIFRYIY